MLRSHKIEEEAEQYGMRTAPKINKSYYDNDFWADRNMHKALERIPVNMFDFVMLRKIDRVNYISSLRESKRRIYGDIL